MLALPKFYTLDNFIECNEFAQNIIFNLDEALGQTQKYDYNTDNFADDRGIPHWQWLQNKYGFTTGFYYQLDAYLQHHGLCMRSFSDIIINCDGGASNIAVLQIPNLSICYVAPTAHEVAFRYLGAILEDTVDYYYDSEGELSVEVIKQNLSDIQKHTAKYLLDSYSKMKLLSRMSRELALVLGCYSKAKQRTEISSVEIRKAVADAGNLEDPLYSPSWLSTQKKNGMWPKESKGGGRRPFTWDFKTLKPYLEKQFPQVEWNNV